ncbi:hypothetical protein EDF46_0058 [Frondihabitans sp. PhB188]|uniref:hypothetical protein n=1 Tax=Frondihabitans sp. PhB188 TaxID=2485200 RepID=UPI000FB24FFB|nr:hypothetical protein [Frondihabitans sp. PhB188]ROQ40698.1 hypothetical protein EDF46_0058 [Frondihabitans sp. PhB188]
MTSGTLPRLSLWVACLAPIVFLPGALDRWFLPKAVVLATACAVASFARTGDGRLPRWFAPLVAAAAVVLVTAAVLSPAPWAEIWGRWPRYEGAVMLPVYVAAVWLGTRIMGPRAPSSRSATLVSGVATASLLLGFVSLLETIGFRPLGSSADRPGALLGNASDQGLVGVVFAAVLLLPTLRAWAPVAAPGVQSRSAARCRRHVPSSRRRLRRAAGSCSSQPWLRRCSPSSRPHRAVRRRRQR